MISNNKLSKAATKKMITQCVTIIIQCQKWQLSGFKTILECVQCFIYQIMQCTIRCEKCFKVISVKEHQPILDRSRMSYFFFVLRYLAFIVYKR